MSFAINKVICKVLGIGVADKVKVSTFIANFLIFSFCATPNLCSSSIINNPKFLKLISFCSNLCVPMITSIFPFAKSSKLACCSLLVLNLLKDCILTPNPAIRSLKVCRCCLAKIVVGTKTATCLPAKTALYAARIATSVLPYPTSPHSNLSIGLGFCISSFISLVAFN